MEKVTKSNFMVYLAAFLLVVAFQSYEISLHLRYNSSTQLASTSRGEPDGCPDGYVRHGEYNHCLHGISGNVTWWSVDKVDAEVNPKIRYYNSRAVMYPQKPFTIIFKPFLTSHYERPPYDNPIIEEFKDGPREVRLYGCYTKDPNILKSRGKFITDLMHTDIIWMKDTEYKMECGDGYVPEFFEKKKGATMHIFADMFAETAEQDFEDSELVSKKPPNPVAFDIDICDPNLDPDATQLVMWEAHNSLLPANLLLSPTDPCNIPKIPQL